MFMHKTTDAAMITSYGEEDKAKYLLTENNDYQFIIFLDKQ